MHKVIKLRLLVLASLASLFGAESVARAGIIFVTENPPGGFFNTIFDNGIVTLHVGGRYSMPVPNPPRANPYVTPDGNFSITGSVSTANMGPGGITYNLMLTVTDRTGARAVVTTEFARQLYDIFPGAPAGWVATEVLAGTFNNVGGGVHGNEVKSTLNIAGFSGPDLVAEDRFGPSFFVVGTFGVNPPSRLVNPVQFLFDVNPVAGDSISIPVILTVTPVPEPSTLVLLMTGVAAVGAARFVRRNRSIGSASPKRKR